MSENHPISYRIKFDYTDLVLKKFDSFKEKSLPEKNKTNKFSFLYIYFLFQPSVNSDVAETFDRRYESLLDKYQLSSLTYLPTVSKSTKQMEERNLLFKNKKRVRGKGPPGKKSYVNPQPLYCKYSYSNITKKMKEINGFEKGQNKIWWSIILHNTEIPLNKENKIESKTNNVDVGRKRKYSLDRLNDNNLSPLLTTAIAKTIPKISEEKELLHLLHKVGNRYDRYNYSIVISTYLFLIKLITKYLDELLIESSRNSLREKEKTSGRKNSDNEFRLLKEIENANGFPIELKNFEDEFVDSLYELLKATKDLEDEKYREYIQRYIGMGLLIRENKILPSSDKIHDFNNSSNPYNQCKELFDDLNTPRLLSILSAYHDKVAKFHSDIYTYYS
ncbi:MAG: hypothetical protein ACOC5D_05530 [Thermoplasmatota archaeon]